MAVPDPALLEHLSTSRFLTGAEASVGSGERRSAFLGAGLEFAAHRDYREGDDTRHLDARLLARLGEPYVRQYAIERQLPIAIVVDASGSMRHGAPDKFATALALAQVFAFVGLAGGDRVEIGLFADGQLNWSPRLSGASQAEWAFGWLAGQDARGTAPFSAALRLAAAHVPRRSQMVLISDWWDEDAEAALTLLGAGGHRILAVNVHAPDEIDPAPAGEGRMRLREIESGEEIEMTIDQDAVAAYRRLLSTWSDSLRKACLHWQGLYFHISSAVNVEHFFLRDLRAAGVIS